MNGQERASGIPARAAALESLSEIFRKNRPADAVLSANLARAGLSARDAGFCFALVQETLRRFGQLEELVRYFVPKPPPPHRAGPTLEILLLGACELLCLGVAPHAAVDAANRLAAHDNKAVHFKGLINATLRNISRDGANRLAQQDAERLNTPDWLWSKWLLAFGEETTRAIARAHSRPAPLDVVVARNDVAPPGDATPLGGGVFRIANAGRIEDLAGYASGGWWVQDFAATLPPRLLGDVKGKTVLDLCAAPGGKAMQLAACGANVVAVEKDSARMAMLKENFLRTGLAAEFIEYDVRDYSPDPAPLVLLDAPCSATGTIRRHPELPWIKSAADINLCAAASTELLDAAANMVAPGGTLVFAVCSLEPEEGLEQTKYFLGRHPEFVRAPVLPSDILGLQDAITPEGDLRTLPCHLEARGGMDGFYAARLRRL